MGRTACTEPEWLYNGALYMTFIRQGKGVKYRKTFQMRIQFAQTYGLSVTQHYGYSSQVQEGTAGPAN